MAYNGYFGVDDKARQIRRIYVGVDGKARKVLKGYVGVGGKARQCFNAYPVVSYVKELDSMTNERGDIGIAGSNHHVLLASGRYSTGSNKFDFSDYVDAYDINLVHSNPTGLSSARWGTIGANLGDLIFFSGGRENNGDNAYNRSDNVDVYNSSLTRSSAANLPASLNGQASIGWNGKLIIAGGLAAGNKISSTVTTYNSSLTKGSLTALCQARIGPCCASNSSNVYFYGGVSDISSGVKPNSGRIDCYNTSFTRTELTADAIRYLGTGVSTSKYAFFYSGDSDNSAVESTALVFNTSNVRTTLSGVPTGSTASHPTGVSLQNLILIPDGSKCRYYDDNLVYRLSASGRSMSQPIGASLANTYGIFVENYMYSSNNTHAYTLS